jgi:hypothetical protein
MLEAKDLILGASVGVTFFVLSSLYDYLNKASSSPSSHVDSCIDVDPGNLLKVVVQEDSIYLLQYTLMVNKPQVIDFPIGAYQMTSDGIGLELIQLCLSDTVVVVNPVFFMDAQFVTPTLILGLASNVAIISSFGGWYMYLLNCFPLIDFLETTSGLKDLISAHALFLGGEASFQTGFTFMDVTADIPVDVPVEPPIESSVTPEIEPQERPFFDLEGHFGAIESEFKVAEAKVLETTDSTDSVEDVE